MKSSLIKTFSYLEKQRRQLKEELKAVEERIKAIQEDLLEEFDELGVDAVKTDDFTIYVDHRIYASPARHEGETIDMAHARAMEKLAEFGWDDVGGIRVNSNALSAKVRKWLQENKELPDDLKDIINVSDVYQIKARKK